MVLNVCFASPVFAELKTQATKDSGSYFWQVITGADPVVKLVMLILLSISVVSWAIIVQKVKEFKQASEGSVRFYELFKRAPNLEDLVVKAGAIRSPVQRIFRHGIADLLKQRRSQDERKPELALSKMTRERLELEVTRATEQELASLEKNISFLATAGSSAPYIGLFGTVWGILSAFWEIGKSGTTSLAVVGPSIAEALIATAIGLAAAIPAVMFYNYFVTRIREISLTVEHFSEDLIARISSEYL